MHVHTKQLNQKLLNLVLELPQLALDGTLLV